MIRVENIKIPINTNQYDLIHIVSKKLGIKIKSIKEFKIYKKSIDARDKQNIHFVYSFDIKLDSEEQRLIKQKKAIAVEPICFKQTKKVSINKRPVIVGSGPAGLFAALILAEANTNPIILERGKNVDERKKDINLFWETGKLDNNSNVQFGEGGAGTFSDGKLTTNLKDKSFIKIIDEFIKAGAPDEISYLSKPHIGTDNLINVIKNIRQKIIMLGGEFRFESKLEDILIQNNKLVGIKVLNNNCNYEIETDNLILAIGHSARDTFEMIYNRGLKIIQKPFSIGARIEHSQQMINESQYGKFANQLGAADYKLAVHLPSKRSVYTFCMCPGGTVVSAASESNKLVVNGMSEYARDKSNSNSALLVGVEPSDFLGDHPLSGMYLQRKIENLAFEAGGKNYNAPVQLVGDFLQNKYSTTLGNIYPSYKPNFKLTNLCECLPDFIISSMREAILIMDNKLKGFANYAAVLTGVETRSSSPIRILRNELLMSNIYGIYPCGEGAGYAGGIMSAAADGIKCASKLLTLL